MTGDPCDPARAEPLHVVARLAEGVVLRAPLMLDALLAWAVTSGEQCLPPVRGAESCDRVEIPIVRESQGRFHLCSDGFSRPEHHELRYKNRRAPAQEYARLGSAKIRRVDIAAGANKGLRIPYELQLLEGDRIEWWCIGDAGRIAVLLATIHYVGRHRGSGKGRLDIHGTPWLVESCEPWDGFPVLRDGRPLRPLPPDYPGILESRAEFRPITFPYWALSQEASACP